MKKTKFLIFSALSLTGIALSTFAAINFSKNGDFLKLFGGGDPVTWNHYSAVAPSFESRGIKEYWVSCSSHGHQFTEPTGDGITIVDAGAPSQSFINSLETSDDRVLMNAKSYSFEDASIEKQSDTVYHITANGKQILRFVSTAGSATVEFDTTNVTNGSKSLHFTVTGGNIEIFVDKNFYNQLGAKGVLFDLLGSSTTSAFNVWNEGNASPDSGRGYIDTSGGWITNNYSKSIMGYWNGDWARLFKSNTGATGNYEFYLDNVRAAESVIDFENDVLYQSNDYYLVKSYASHTQSISTEKAHTGNKSLKVEIPLNGRGLCISDGIYSILPDEGLSFYLYSETAFNANIPNSGGSLQYHSPVSQWKQYTIPKANMEKINGDAYYTLFLPTAATTVYIDDLAPAKSIIDFENNELHARLGMAKHNNSDTQYVVSSYDGVTFAGVSDERAFEGRKAYKVTTSDAHQMALKINDNLYNALGDEGLTFRMYCDKAFYYGTNGGDLLYDNPGEWVEITLSKANLDPTAGRHYVFLPREVVTVYVDNVRPAPAS